MQSGRLVAVRSAGVAFRPVYVAALACTWLVLLAAPSAQAYTWMIKHGYGGCVTCHADPSGGELLTEYGRVQGDLLLRMRYGADEDSATASQTGPGAGDFDSFDSLEAEGDAAGQEAPAQAAEPAEGFKPGEGEGGPSDTSGFLWGLVTTPDWLLLGGSYRHMTIWEPSGGELSTFPMQIDLYGQVQFGPVRAGGSLGIAKVGPASPHARDAQITTNDTGGFNLISRTHWIGADIGPKYTVRGGRLNLPFGVRTPEHVAWVREQTRTDRESDQQHGVAVAYNGDFLRGEVMAIAGNYQVSPDAFRERGYSFFLETRVLDPVAVGVSSLLTFAEADRVGGDSESTTRQAHGIFGRIALSNPLVVLVEADALLKSRQSFGYVAFLQLDYELVQGLHLLGTGELLDRGVRESAGEARTQTGAGEPAFGGWLGVDWFFLPHFEARIDGVFRQEDPFQLLAQFHVYL
jgi:hypothetical protein